MLYTIENDYLTAQIDTLGAQLCSLVLKEDGHEYIWQGDPAVWSGRAPVLFPVIGQLKNDEYLYGGRTYPMKKHGFARKLSFEAEVTEKSRAVFLLKASEETRASFPFEFELEVCYELVGRALKCTQKVTDTDPKTMFFSLGAHPGFNCVIGDCLEFDEDETGLECEKIDRDNILIDKKFPVPLEDGKRIRLTEHLFDDDALILGDLNSTVVTLLADGGERTVRFDFGDVPYLGIWAKPNAPYVCIEPWYGINDELVGYSDISDKRGIISLATGDETELVWIAEV